MPVYKRTLCVDRVSCYFGIFRENEVKKDTQYIIFITGYLFYNKILLIFVSPKVDDKMAFPRISSFCPWVFIR